MGMVILCKQLQVGNCFFNKNGERKSESEEVDTLPYTFILDSDYLQRSIFGRVWILKR